MKRRYVLSGTSSSAVLLLAGCLDSLLSSCPDPDMGDELSYEERNSERLTGSRDEAILVTDSDDVDQFDKYHFDIVDEGWVRDTDFETHFVLGIQVISSGESSDLEVLGVERVDPTTVRAYTCITRSGMTDDAVPYVRLLCVPHDGDVPEAASVVHWEDGDERTIE